MTATGKVILVGAGPGAADLITLRGVAALRQADVVLYDRLVDPTVLDHVPADAQRIYAGRAPGDCDPDRQSHIHRQLIAHARAGRTVVRLKGGDPFVFGRGGEEMLALAQAGVPCEVVPGVTAAVAVPAAAGVPVTHRGVATAFAVFTGHEAGEGALGVDWGLAASIPTAVFLMGVVALPVIVRELIAHGRSADTPAMLIERGTLPGQRIVSGRLADFPDAARDIRPPATLIVGNVVGISALVREAAQHAGSRPVDVQVPALRSGRRTGLVDNAPHSTARDNAAWSAATSRFMVEPDTRRGADFSLLGLWLLRVARQPSIRAAVRSVSMRSSKAPNAERIRSTCPVRP